MPFFGGQQIYKAVGSNIIGGVNTLVTNEGDNNIGIGNSVLSSIVDSSGMIFVGNEAGQNLSEENNPSDDVIAIGKAALKNADYVRDAIFIGLNAGDNIQNSEADIAIGLTALRNANNGVAELQGYNIAIGYECMESAQRATQNIALGTGVMSNVTRADRNIVFGDNSADNWGFALENIVIGNLSFIGDAFTSDQQALNNIIIGNNIDTSDTDTVNDRILIGNNIISGGDPEIIIGDPNITYSQILIGGVDLLAGGGSFGAQAEQIDDEQVSISSSASDGLAGFGGTYSFNAETDNANTANSSSSFTAITPDYEINENKNLEILLTGENIGASHIETLTLTGANTTISDIVGQSLTDGTITKTVQSENATANVTVNTESTIYISENDDNAEYSHEKSISNTDKTITAGSTYSVALFEVNSGSYNNITIGNAFSQFDSNCNIDATSADYQHQIRTSFDNVSIQTVNIAASSDGVTNTFFLELNNTDVFNLTAPSDTGAQAAPNYAIANAPVAGLTVTNYLAVTFNGVAGYIPFLSA
jgi:hypothetical protein